MSLKIKDGFPHKITENHYSMQIVSDDDPDGCVNGRCFGTREAALEWADKVIRADSVMRGVE